MSACSAQVFSNVTPAVWNCLVQKAAGYNITITTPNGQQTKDGFTQMGLQCGSQLCQ
jgi:hypothetical protein